MNGERLAALFEPRGIAVVGASSDPDKLGSVMMATLQMGPTPVVGVNARRPDEGAYVHRNLADAAARLPGPLDLVVSCVPAASTADIVVEAARANAGAVLVCAGGFSEIGEAGERHERPLQSALDETGVRLLGPNTSGFLVPHRGLFASFVPGAVHIPSGGVAVVATSGGVNHALAFGLAQRGLGLRLSVGVGGALDVTQADVLDHLAGDEDLAAVALHVETVEDGRHLVEAVRALVPRVPVVALVLGESDVGAFAQSHTGALATSWRTMRAALAQAGAVVVHDDREMLDAVSVLARHRLPPRAAPGFGVVTAQAGPALLATDGARARGVRIPELRTATVEALGRHLPPLTYQRNPVDTGRPGPSFASVLKGVATDDQIDALAVYALLEPGAFDFAAALEGITDDLPVVVGTAGIQGEVANLRQAVASRGHVLVETAAELAAVLCAWDADSRARARLAEAAQALDSAPLTIPDTVDEASVKAMLEPLVRTPRRAVCKGLANAREALARFGTVVVKMVDAEVLHKSEVGGVVVGVRTQAELTDAWRRVHRADVQRVLVEQQAPDGPELILGLRRDPVFGPTVVLGLGGTTAEALQQVTIGLAPLSRPDAWELVDSLPGREVVTGWRGGPMLDVSSLVDLLVELSARFSASEPIRELEINPLRVLPDGALIALDAMMIVDR